MLDLVPVRRALLSVSDKTDLIPFAKTLASLGVELVSTGGTARALAEAGLEVVTVETLTGHPEILDGRVKTLHPRVHGGVLARRDLPAHLEALETHGISAIDLVCINLYPFERTIRSEGIEEAEAIEQIDIGGPALMRSAAKNFESVAVVTSPSQYDAVASELTANEGRTSRALRADLAAAAFSRTCEYDAAISAWMGHRQADRFAETLRMTFTGGTPLRYGENPHQRGALYRDPAAAGPSIAGAGVLGGKALSYNNILDASAGLELVLDLRSLARERRVAAVIKHTNPCGAAIGDSLADSFRRAWDGDSLAAFGSVVVLGGDVDGDTATSISDGSRFLEVIVADRFTPEAASILSQRWPSARLVETGPPAHAPSRPQVRSIARRPSGQRQRLSTRRRPGPRRGVEAGGGVRVQRREASEVERRGDHVRRHAARRRCRVRRPGQRLPKRGDEGGRSPLVRNRVGRGLGRVLPVPRRSRGARRCRRPLPRPSRRIEAGRRDLRTLRRPRDHLPAHRHPPLPSLIESTQFASAPRSSSGTTRRTRRSRNAAGTATARAMARPEPARTPAWTTRCSSTGRGSSRL
jgi:phosphoribosylaminoimidazolecarboxamide formyltransferase/IMP cyclohydrolase